LEVTSLDQLAESEVQLLLGIESSSVVMRIVSEEVILAYGLDQKLVEASTSGISPRSRPATTAGRTSPSSPGLHTG